MHDDMDEYEAEKGIATGVALIKDYVKTLPPAPGVYRMLAGNGDVLYVGKAKALKKRVLSYTQFDKLPIRLKRMVAQTRAMEFITTHTEAEALLLEANLIKKFQPRYNILLRDDKSFPYILVRGDHDFPQILKHRGNKSSGGTYFGPFASAGDVNRTIAILQKVFMLRNCTDSYFSARTRPCLQYHIKRCTAPCVGKVSQEDYAEQVRGAQSFMEGKSRDIQDRLTHAMEDASTAQDYEKAAQLRDRIRALTGIQARQDINLDLGDADVFAIAQEAGKSCVQVFFFRGGRNMGNRSYFPRHQKDEVAHDILSAFMGQFYQNKPVPRDILLNVDMPDRALLEEAFATLAKVKVTLHTPQRGQRKRLIDFVTRNAAEALARQAASGAAQGKLLAAVAGLFGLEEPPKRIEVYDNSHISGTNMVGAMIVAGPEGLQKNAYRQFNIKFAGAADDYAMMREVLTRRFKRLVEQGESEAWPDLVLIDGGAGQLSAAQETLEDLGVLDRLCLVAISKGPDRNAGREKFHMPGRPEFQLPEHDPVLQYLQRLRDEAHRFAITQHRSRRGKQISASPLDEISGIGARRKKALLLHFGSAKAVAGAGVDDLCAVEGVSRALAQKIYDFFHA
jgi:excinuclease ABC subunit C